MRYILFFLVFVCVNDSSAGIRLPKLFGNGMVLQRDEPIKIWGWANPNEKVTVSFKFQQKTVKAAINGTWQLFLAKEPAGGPYQLIIRGGKEGISIDDVLLGDVWVCSGQSNMEFAVSSSLNAKEEIENASFPLIRHIEIPKAMAYHPKDDLDRTVQWKQANSENVGRFTAVGYFYAKALQEKLNIPIGLIHTSWGGTDIETWISRSALETSNLFTADNMARKNVDLEQLIKQRKIDIIGSMQKKQDGFPKDALVKTFQNTAFDDSKWPLIKLPGLWEQSIENFDGVVWFRKTIILSADYVSGAGLLELARIDDSDETYVNGIKVGGLKDKYSDKRTYPISAGILKQGENVIAIRVEDTGGGGGIYGTPDEIKLTIGDNMISLAGNWKYQVESVFENSSSNTGNIGNPNDYPTLLFNAMIYPLTKFAIKGVIWYQGENNANRAYQYRTTFPLLINDWRTHWNLGIFPFYYVQLASWRGANGNSNAGSSWAELREAQSLTQSTTNTGMAITIDIGETNDIHPKNKQDVGKRLAAIALNKTYDKKNVFSGPVLDNYTIKADSVIIAYKNVENGLLIKDKYGYVKGFELAGSDKKFHYAMANVTHNKIILSSKKVKKPIAIRYAWADNPNDANVFNKEGFPAVPFRTDDWEVTTRHVKYSIN
ncbi:sialate O-acetylesterase [Pedobacter nanyangensis]|jgi:sialate O-acetylesterase|uniref:sialate O-acetylesterase n=1 Tax=Pedobacter nanyangensis TaxID=1562389 RepID=UPI000DE3ECC9|nr:sialate O-acetylesterase [Pedobacter nanyangensis]